MNKLLLIAVSIALLRVPGVAAPCSPGTLASYIALGSAGCTLGNLTVAGLTYNANAGGGAVEITADQIAMTPLLAPTGTFGLQFAAPWTIASGQSLGSHATHDLQVYPKCTEVCRSQTSAQLNLAAPAGALVVADRVTLQSKLGTAAMTSFADWFVVWLACV